jgi:tetratricopeptide (TPR) repeat protein
MKKTLLAIFVGLVATAMCFAIWAQNQQPKPSTKMPQAKTQQEYEAYKKFQGETDPAKKAAAGEQFIRDYPDSELTGPFVCPLLVQIFEQLNNFSKAVEYGEKSLNSDLPKETVLFIYQGIVISYQQLNNYEKTVEWGEKFLTADPNNTFALYILSSVIPERIKDEDVDRQSKLDRTSDYGKRLLQIIANAQRPAQLTDEQWKQQKAQLEGGDFAALGFVALHQKNYDEAVRQYKQSTDIYPKDPIAFYRLGMAYSFNKKNEEAIRALATSVALSGPPQAKSYLDEIYKAKNKGSLEGLDKVIADAKASMKN